MQIRFTTYVSADKIDVSADKIDVSADKIYVSTEYRVHTDLEFLPLPKRCERAP